MPRGAYEIANWSSGAPRSLPRGPRTISPFVKQLGRFLRERPAEDALADQVFWLGAA